ncbi:MAG: translation initiation factor IF-5A [Candidatus Bathyarchaeota archaeon]|nr:translation initiation factor IF-5A [Candidatus Bathyarchaeum tardum]WGM89658.1 MAG: translation initiation factor IF-5A [Candidatus Bathyarchaeum tardum]WNZ30241.1 MAG: translation initiation factor IF-5A [Candidatus Bathyarchaeota archaeon]
MSVPKDVGELKVGSYIIIDDEPCKIVSYSKSKPGKHGAAKARIVAIGVFNEAKKTIVKPVSAQVDVPIIDKSTGQVIALLPSAVQLMNLESYEMTESPYPEEEEIKSKLESGVEVEYWHILGRTRITRIKG